MSRRAKLAIAFAIVYLVWGSTYMVASIGVHIMPPVLFGGVRFICAGLLLGIVWLALFATQGRRAHPLDRRTITGLVIGFAGTALIVWPRGGAKVDHFGMQL